jgi:hypothetical protein
MWLHLTKQEEGNIVMKIANEHHWKRSTRMIDPTKPNPSVSEFTYRMSRKSARV